MCWRLLDSLVWSCSKKCFTFLANLILRRKEHLVSEVVRKRARKLKVCILFKLLLHFTIESLFSLGDFISLTNHRQRREKSTLIIVLLLMLSNGLRVAFQTALSWRGRARTWRRSAVTSPWTQKRMVVGWLGSSRPEVRQLRPRTPSTSP